MIDYPFAGPVDDPYSFQMAEPVAKSPALDLPETGWYNCCYICGFTFEDKGRYAAEIIKSPRRNYGIGVHKICLPKKKS